MEVSSHTQMSDDRVARAISRLLMLLESVIMWGFPTCCFCICDFMTFKVYLSYLFLIDFFLLLSFSLFTIPYRVFNS